MQNPVLKKCHPKDPSLEHPTNFLLNIKQIKPTCLMSNICKRRSIHNCLIIDEYKENLPEA